GRRSVRGNAAQRESVERPINSGHCVHSFLTAPRTFSANKPTCNAISAHAFACQAQAIHSTLLTMNHQNPASRRGFFCDATSHAANKVTAMAGHWMVSSNSMCAQPL